MRESAGNRWRLRIALGVVVALSIFILLELLRPERPGPPEPASESGEVAAIEARIDRLREENLRLSGEIEGISTERVRPESAPAPADAIPANDGGSLGHLHVRVVGPNGDPLAGATVSTVQFTKTPPIREADRREAVTDGSGEVTIPDLEPVRTTVRASLGSRSRSRAIPIKAGETAEVTLAFPAGGVVEGTVTHRVNGALPNLYVSFSRATRGSEFYSGRTDGAGGYRIEGVPPGRYLVRINGRGIVRTLPTEHCEVTVPDAKRCTRDFLIGVPSIHGMCTDAETGLPLNAVELQTERGITIHRSGESGAYEFTDLPPGRQLFRVRKTGYADTVIVTEVTGAEEGVTFDLALQPEVPVVVRVVGRDGRPYTGDISAIWGLKIGPSASLSTGARLTTDMNGEARIRRLAPGVARLWFKTDGSGSARQTVTLRRGDNHIEVRLE